MAFECKPCNKEFKNQGGLNLHNRKHAAPKDVKVPPLRPVVEVGVERNDPTKVLFYSPKSPNLTIVVKPEYWARVETPGGEQSFKVAGKTVEFLEGRFSTSDPEIIAYLETIYNSLPGSGRFPVVSSRVRV